jgi:serine phosphatase RsbU (regulator of sigma subunit)
MTADDFGAGRDDVGEQGRGLRERLSGQAEDAIGRLADDLLENPLINSALQRALGARDKVAQAQETAMEALNIPSATSLDKIARRLRSISQRLDELEDGVEKVDRRLTSAAETGGASGRLVERLDRIESRLDDLSRDVSALRGDVSRGDAISASQTRAVVPEG